MTLLVVYDPDNLDARVAAGVLLSKLGPGRRHRSSLPLPRLHRVSVLFVGAPEAHVLAQAHREARAVAVVARHMAPLFTPKGVLWASGYTLEEAARNATGCLA